MLTVARDTNADSQHFAADQCNALRNTMDLHFLAYIEVIDRTKSWYHDAVPSLEHWISVRYGMTLETARNDVMAARAVKRLPAIAAAYGEGLLSKDKLVVLCSFVDPDDDSHWALEAQRYSAAQIRRSARCRKRLERDETAAIDKRRELNMIWDWKAEVLRFHGELPGADGALLKKAVERLIKQPVKGPNGEWIPIAERQADALVELAATSLGADADKARATVVVHVDARDLNAVNGTATLEDGPVVASEVARRLACDGHVQTIIESDGTVTGIGRRSRIIPKALERAVRARDTECACCGASNLTWSEIHHIIPWSRGGRTDLDNLVVVCRRCHRLIHERRYDLRRRNGTITVRHPDGRTLVNRPTPLRPDIKARMVGPPVT